MYVLFVTPICPSYTAIKFYAMTDSEADRTDVVMQAMKNALKMSILGKYAPDFSVCQFETHFWS